MSDKKDKPVKQAFDAVSDFGRDISREFSGYKKYFGNGTFVKDAADYVRQHGKDRLKTGAATAFKVGAATWKTGPLLKLTVPAAFAAGVIGGPKVSRHIADTLDRVADKMPKLFSSTEKAGGKPPTPTDP